MYRGKGELELAKSLTVHTVTEAVLTRFPLCLCMSCTTSVEVKLNLRFRFNGNSGGWTQSDICEFNFKQ